MFDMFTTPRASSPSQRRAYLLDTWREASQLVWVRWHAFLDAPTRGRGVAFAAYVAALDAEDAAARDLAGTLLAYAA